jgi:two-component system cell cycle sensor histidine kinase/response regulator CckA
MEMYAANYAAPSGRGSSDTPGRGTETILLVEDDTDVRIATRRLLERMGYHVLEAGTPQAALDLAVVHRGKIDAVLSDVIMPGMNGPMLVAEIRTLRPQLPVLFMSACDDDESMERFGLRALDVCFIAKPFTPAELALKLRAALSAK